jgi:hypothetical protein
MKTASSPLVRRLTTSDFTISNGRVAGELYAATEGSPEFANLAAADYSIPTRASRQRSGRDQKTGPEQREGSR